MRTKRSAQVPEDEILESEGHTFVRKSLSDAETAPEGMSVRKPERKKTEKKKESWEKRVDRQQIGKQLTEIYENTDGSMPDMTTFPRQQHRRFMRAFATLMISCLLLGGVAWAGFFLVQPESAFSEKDVVLTMSGDEIISVGKEVNYRIRYRNAQQVALAQAVVHVRYPEGFVFERASIEPANDTKDEWSLGTIKEDTSGFIDITGRMYGNIGDKQSFRVFLDYVPANFSSEFQKVATLSAEVKDSPFTIEIQVPKEVIAGAETDVTIIVRRTGETAVPSSALVLDTAQFSKKKSAPGSDEFHENRWSLDSAAKEKKIVIQGVFLGNDTATTVDLQAQIVGWKDAKKTGEGFVLAKTVASSVLVRSGLDVTLAINGAPATVAAQPGEVLMAQIRLKNTKDTPLQNVQVRFVIDAPSVDRKSILNWVKLEDALDGDILGEQVTPELRRGSITWSKKQQTELASLVAGEEFNHSIKLPIKSSKDADITEYPSTDLKATVEVRYESDGKQEIVSSQPFAVSLVSDLAIEIQHESTAGSDGKEKHEMKWVLTNSYHNLKQVRVEADLYGDITWHANELSVPAGKAVFNERDKKLVWTIDEMPTSVDVLALPFAFTLNKKNPTQTLLISKVKVQALDTVVNKEIIKVGAEVPLQ